MRVHSLYLYGAGAGVRLIRLLRCCFNFGRGGTRHSEQDSRAGWVVLALTGLHRASRMNCNVMRLQEDAEDAALNAQAGRVALHQNDKDIIF